MLVNIEFVIFESRFDRRGELAIDSVSITVLMRQLLLEVAGQSNNRTIIIINYNDNSI